MTTINGTPTKLRDGNWGVKVVGNHSGRFNKGDVVEVKVTTKAGKTWTQTSQVIWTDIAGRDALLRKVEERSNRGGGSNRRSLKCYSCYARFEREPIDDQCPKCGDFDSIS